MGKKLLGTLDRSSNLRETFPLATGNDDTLDLVGNMICATGQEYDDILAGYAQTLPQSVETCIAFGDSVLLHLAGDTHVRAVRDGHVQQCRAAPGGFSLQPRGESIKWDWNAPSGNMGYLLSDALKRSVCQDLSNTDPDRVALRWEFYKHDPLIEHIGRSVIADLLSGSPLGRMYIDALSQTLMLHLLRNFSTLTQTRALPEQGLSPRQRERVEDYMRANITRNITLAELAAAISLSPSHFSRQFKLSTGRSPHQYLLQLRVSLARDLILSGQTSLAAVARQVGFADHSHMTRHFRDVLGLTPSDLLKSARMAHS